MAKVETSLTTYELNDETILFLLAYSSPKKERKHQINATE